MIGHPLSDAALPFRKIVDCGILGYREFACSIATYEWLKAGAMTHVDGQPVRLTIAERCVGGHNVIVQAWTPEVHPDATGMAEWQKAAA